MIVVPCKGMVRRVGGVEGLRDTVESGISECV